MSSEAEEIQTLTRRNEIIRLEVSRIRQFIDSLQTLVAALDESLAAEDIMPRLSSSLEHALNCIDAKNASLLILEEDSQELVFVLTHGDMPSNQLLWRRIPKTKGVAGWVVKHQEATIINDVQTDERFYAEFDTEYNFTTESILAVPVIGSGRVFGVVEIINKRGGRMFDNDDQTLISLMCGFAGELLYKISVNTES